MPLGEVPLDEEVSPVDEGPLEKVHPYKEVPQNMVPLEEVVHLDKAPLDVVLLEEVPLDKEVPLDEEVSLVDEVPLEEVHLDKVHPYKKVPLDVVHLDKVPPDLVPLGEVVPLKEPTLSMPAQGELVVDRLEEQQHKRKLHQMEADSPAVAYMCIIGQLGIGEGLRIGMDPLRGVFQTMEGLV